MLAGNTLNLSIFFDLVGKEVHGAGWPENAASLLDLGTFPRKNTPQRAVRQIHDDLINAFFSETIDVCFYHPAIVKLKGGGRPDFGLSPPVGSQAFVLKPDFWLLYQQQDRQVEWGQSTSKAYWCDVWWSRINDVQRHSQDAEIISEGIEPFHYAECLLLIREPLRSFEKFFKSIEVPDEKWLKRYAKHRTDFSLEVVAAGWRYLAVEQPSDLHGLGEKLVEALRQYLSEQLRENSSEMPLSDPALKSFAANILAQWRAVPPTRKSVLVNSTRPTARKR